MADTYDVVVIGSGPGGYVAAIRATQLGLKTACVEKDKALGGTCLNVGCIPSKCLLHSSEMYDQLRRNGKTHGIDADPKLNFPQMMKRKEEVVAGFNVGIDALFKKNKITRIKPPSPEQVVAWWDWTRKRLPDVRLISQLHPLWKLP